jgi:hypothetical protein
MKCIDLDLRFMSLIIRVMSVDHEAVKQKHVPSPDMARHPSMHRRDTLDMFTITRGEIYLVTDTNEVLPTARS